MIYIYIYVYKKQQQPWTNTPKQQGKKRKSDPPQKSFHRDSDQTNVEQ